MSSPGSYSGIALVLADDQTIATALRDKYTRPLIPHDHLSVLTSSGNGLGDPIIPSDICPFVQPDMEINISG